VGSFGHAAKHHDEEQLTVLASLIAGINPYDHMNIVVQQPAGEQRPRRCRGPEFRRLACGPRLG
jgi:hypothetical protein